MYRSNLKLARAALTALTALALVSCGSGGDEDRVPASTDSASPGAGGGPTAGGSPSTALSAAVLQAAALELRDTYAATLTGSEVVPATQSTARGAGTIVVNPNTRLFTATLTLVGMTATSASIRSGGPGTNGEIVFNLQETSPGSGVWTTTMALTEAQLGDFRAATGLLYFTATSAAHAQGEIRGQILPHAQSSTTTGTAGTAGTTGAGTFANPGTGTTGTGAFATPGGTGTTGTGTFANPGSTGATGTGTFATPGSTGATGAGTFATPGTGTGTAGGMTGTPGTTNTTTTGATTTSIAGGAITFVSALRGQHEVPANSSAAVGAGAIVLDPATGEIVAAATTSGLAGTAAHLHIAPPGVNGPSVFPLTETSPGSGVWATRATLSAEQLASLRAGEFHFNVHTAAFPGGEIRGQVFPYHIAVGTSGSFSVGAAQGSGGAITGTGTTTGTSSGSVGTGTTTSTSGVFSTGSMR